MSERESLIVAAFDRAENPMHHFIGSLAEREHEHDQKCPGCDLQRLATALETALVAFYEHDAPACANLCDEVLDRRGALLGRVRIWATNRKASRV